MIHSAITHTYIDVIRINSVSKDWILLRTSSSRHQFHSHSQTVMEGVRISLQLARKPYFYSISTVVPFLALCLLNPFVFVLPLEHGERVSFSVALLLSYAVMLGTQSDVLPSSTEYVCYLGILVSVCVFISGSIALLVIVVASMGSDDGVQAAKMETVQPRQSNDSGRNPEINNSPPNGHGQVSDTLFNLCGQYQDRTVRQRVVGPVAGNYRNIQNILNQKKEVAHAINKYAFVVTMLVTVMAICTTVVLILN